MIFYQNNQLQSIIYYRDDGNSKPLNQIQLAYGLNHMGAMIGVYQNGAVIGAAKDWSLDTSTVQNLFLAQGTADISRGNNPELYYCSGSQIANNSYVVNVTSMLNLNQRLANDDTIHQYPDPLHEVGDPFNNNQMNADLNMDYTDQNGNKTQNNIIFQNNPKCTMDPNKPETMKDYSASNHSGCKNKQLGFEVSYDNNGAQILTVTGFIQGGIDAGISSSPYVGALSAASLQPTKRVAVGAACTQGETGKMAQQKSSSNPNDVNNIYVNQVICMKSPTCPAEASGFCYLPVQNVTINFVPVDKPASYMCPAGMFITNVETNVKEYPDWGNHCCNVDPIMGCEGYASSHDHFWEGYTFYKDTNLIGQTYAGGANVDGSSEVNNPLHIPHVEYIEGQTEIKIPNRIVLGVMKYASTCDAICRCPPQVRPPWQPGITSITCTNDPSKANITVDVN